MSTWRTANVVIAAGCLMALVTFGVRTTFGLFLGPMTGDMGWGRETFAVAIALQHLFWGLGQPFAGAIADRQGSGRVLVGGGVCYVAGVWIMALVSTPLMLHLSAGVLVGLGLAGAGQGVILAVVGRSVSAERRSWALGVATAAGSLGQFTLTPIGQAFLEAYGWSTALLLLGGISLILIPLAGVMTGRPDAIPGPEQTLGEALHEATRHSGFIYLTLGFFVCGFHVAFIAAHLPSYVTDLGLDARIGAWAIALVGLFNIIGSYTSGVLGGRHSKKYLLSFLYLSRSVVILAFVMAPPSATSVLVFSSAMGLLWLSTVPLTSGLVAQIFGPRYMATLFGIVFLSHQIGSFIGVWMGGYLFDRTGSYDVVWWTSIALGVIAAVLHFPIDERAVQRTAQAA